MPSLPLGGLEMAACVMSFVSYYFVWLDVYHPAEHGSVPNDLLMLFFLSHSKLEKPDLHRARGERVHLAEWPGLAEPVPAAGHLLTAGEARVRLHPEDALRCLQVDRLPARGRAEDHPVLAALEGHRGGVLVLAGHPADDLGPGDARLGQR